MEKANLIFDVGSTKTSAVCYGIQSKWFSLPGFNPHHEEWSIFEQLIHGFFESIDFDIQRIRLYGSGLNSDEFIRRMHSILSSVSQLTNDSIGIYSDLLLCAHAVYSNQPVLVGILGTGSNIGYFDGKQLSQRTPSLGYLLGDEGAGTDIGRRILITFAYRLLPDKLMKELSEEFGISISTILKSTYQSNELKQMSSNLAKFANKYCQSEEIKFCLEESIGGFIKNRILPELNHRPEIDEIFICGSVGRAFQQLYGQAVKVHTGIKMTTIGDPLAHWAVRTNHTFD